MASRKEEAHEQSRPSGKRKRVLLVDDHPLVREGLVTLIRATPDLEVMGESGNSDEALRALSEDLPDLVLVDLSLPGRNGLDLIREIRSKYPKLRVLVLSMYEEGVYAERALRAGAHGYIMKQAPGAKIIEAIRTVLRGEVYVSPTITTRMLQLLVDGSVGENRHSDLEGLSDRELQVFTSIGNGLATQEIADVLKLSVKTIQTYREHIKRKLGLRNATDLVHYATQRVQSEGR